MLPLASKAVGKMVEEAMGSTPPASPEDQEEKQTSHTRDEEKQRSHTREEDKNKGGEGREERRYM